MPDDRIVQYRELPLSGRLRTSADPAELISEGGIIDYSVLQNMRYKERHPQAIGGTTKVNTTVLANPKVQTMFQWRKDSPAESNVLVSALDSNSLNQKVYRNETAIPSAGDFVTAAVFTDASGYGTPKFSTAPGDKLIYCNGKDTAIWGGEEMKPIGFIDQDPNGTYKYDYTEQVKNSLTDSNNIATLHRVAGVLDSNAEALFHFDGADGGTTLTDSSGGTHGGTAVGDTATETADFKFGSACCHFDGTTDYFTIADHGDFDFSGTGSDGKWTIDFWIKNQSGSTSHAPSGTWFSHATDAGTGDYIRIGQAGLSIYAASSEVVTLAWPGGTFLKPSGSAYSWHHVAVVGNKSGGTYDYYLFWDGALKASLTGDAQLPANYNSALVVGAWDNGTTIADVITHSMIDELRISSSARWTGAFDPPTSQYGTSAITTLYVGSQLPLQGINPYVLTANATPGSVTGNYWSESGWATLGTISGVGATPLSSTGKNTWTFTSTASTARQKSIDDKVAYWYRFDITECDTTTTLYQVTLDTPMQALKELWDGQYRTAGSFLVYKSSTFNDYTVNVFNDSWTSTDTNTFAELDSLATATDSLYFGFSERQMGIRLNLIGGHVNTTAGTSATVSYYNGTGPHTTAASWTPVSGPDDNTVNAAISLAKSGSITWTPPSLSSEFKVSISNNRPAVGPVLRGVFGPVSGSTASGVQTTAMYFYKVTFNQNLSADVQLYFAGGITAPEDVAGHAFGVHHVDRLWLWGDEKDPLRGFCTGLGTSQVLRGDDTVELYLKNKPVAGVSLFERYGSTAANVQLVCEPTRTWAIVGSGIEDFSPTLIADSNGCIAANTMDASTVETLPGQYRRVGMWLSHNGVVMSEGSGITNVSVDIEDKFDPKHSNYLTAAVLRTCTGWIDPVYNEYHLVVPGATQWVYDILKKRWYEAPLAATKRLNCGVAVYDTSGIAYSYGSTASGYMYRMEYGTTVDGEGIPLVMQTADIAPTGNIMDRTEACSIRLVGKATGTTAVTVLIEHFGDSSTTTSVPAITGVSTANAGSRLFSVIRSMGVNPKNFVFHSYKFSRTTTNETIGFEPIFAIIGYRNIGKDTRG